MKKRAVTYARVSSEKEMQLSAFENQLHWYDEIENRYSEEYTFIDRYMDKGITGTSAKKRPGFMKMIEDAKKGKFDVIFTREVARFARNFVESVSYTRELEKYGVEVRFINDNISSFNSQDSFKLGLMSLMAEEESRKDSERAKAGLHIARTQRGSIWGSGNILGYKPRGGRGCPFEIDKEQAKTVIMIKDMYLYERLSAGEIKDRLEKLGRKTATGCDNWQVSTITRILDNPFYAGMQRLRQSEVNNFLEQKRIKLPKEEVYLKKVDVPTLYTVEEYEEILKIKAERYVKIQRKIETGKRRHYFWSRKLQCGCGSSMRGGQWRVVRNNEPVIGYRCSNQVMNKSKESRERLGLSVENACSISTTPEWKLNFMALHIFNHIWENKGLDIEEAVEIIKSCYKKSESHSQEEVDRLNKEISKFKNKKDNLVDMCAEGLIDKETLRKKVSECDENIKLLQASILSLEEEDDTLLNIDKQIEKIRSTLTMTLNCSSKGVDEDVLDELIDLVVKTDDNSYQWFLNLDKSDEDEVVNIPLEYQIKIKRKHCFKSEYVIKDKRKCVYSGTLHYDEALAYRKANGAYMRPNAWTDLNFEVYI